MRLNPPSLTVFLIAAALAGLAVATKFGGVAMIYFRHQDFWCAFAAYLVLMLGSLVRGL